MKEQKNYSVASQEEARLIKEYGSIRLGGRVYYKFGKYKTLKEAEVGYRYCRTMFIENNGLSNTHTHDRFICKVNSLYYILSTNWEK